MTIVDSRDPFGFARGVVEDAGDDVWRDIVAGHARGGSAAEVMKGPVGGR